MTEQAEQWLRFAKMDLDSARKLESDPDLGPIVVYHLHQAVEKSLTAILEDKGQSVPRIHDLIRLATLCTESGTDLPIDQGTLAGLNDVYIDSRYPGALRASSELSP
ncbi:MAG: HEPN domain-containing protein, partial [Spirochaetaceae bacterium]|nr:HEPN domain-containing protein [Spirochaetaceae bacterium]